MSGFWVPPGKQSFTNPATGAPLAGGFVYHYIPGTDTPKDTFTDQAETTPNTNPIVLDGNGECTVWGEGLFRQVLRDASGVQLWDQVTGFIGAASGVLFASPAEVLAGVDNTKVISPFALANSGVLALPVASAAEVLAGVINNKVVTPKNLKDSGVILPVASPAEIAALTINTKVITPGNLGASGVLGGSGSVFPSLTAFSFVGDGVTDNAGHMAAMLASSSTLIYVPDGIFYISGDGPTQRARFQRRMWGPGKFLFADGYCTPGRYTNISAPPALWPSQGVTGWFHGDTSNVEPEWHVLGVGVRESITARYFEAATLPHNIWYDVLSGASGLLTMASGALLAGAGSADLISSDGVTPGQTLGVTPYGQNGAITDTITIDTVAGNHITFHPNLTTNYPNLWPNGVVPGLATFISGKRTWAGVFYMKIGTGTQGGGDVYGAIARLTQNLVPKTGQRHVFNTGTIALFGGEMTFAATAGGTFGTGWENQVTDNTADVAYAAFVDSFTRANDFGARGAFWVGRLWQSNGPWPVDVGTVYAGAFRFAMDATRASLEDSTVNTAAVVAGTNTITLSTVGGVIVGNLIGFTDGAGIPIEYHGVQSIDYATKIVTIDANWANPFGINNRVRLYRAGAAMNLALGQNAIIFNSTVGATGRASDPTGGYPTVYGNQTGDLIMRSGSDGVGDFWATFFNRASPNNGRIRLRPTVFQVNVVIQGALTIESGTDLVSGSGRVIYGPGLGCIIERDAGTGRLRATSNNGAAWTFLTP